MRINLSFESEHQVYNLTSVFHNVLMEHVDQGYAEILHKSHLMPYSQYIEIENQKICWYINTFDVPAAQCIMRPVLAGTFDSIRLEDEDLRLTVIDKELNQQTFDELFHEYYFKDGPRSIGIRFITPTAFFTQGEYIFFPEPRLLYKDLISKFDAFSKEAEIGSEETLEDLVQHTAITGYDLRSYYFDLGSQKIPAFVGSMNLKINGPQALVNLANLLLAYGEYTGIGTNCPMGMGAIRRFPGKGVSG